MTAFSRWDDARAAATTADQQRALLGEIARWRALHLTDMVGQRDATWAIARLQQALGDTEAALREARSLASLCQVPPAAAASDLAAADNLVAELGGGRTQRPRKSKTREERRSKQDRGESRSKERKPAPERVDPLEQAVVHGRAQAYSEAFKSLRGKGGPKAQLIRTWLDLKQAVEGPAEARDEALAALLKRVERALPGPAPKAPAPPPAPDEGPDDTRVGRLLGRRLPQRRAKALRAVQVWIDRHPDQADAMAAASLLDHLDAAGTAPAPWLAGFVGQALVDEGPQTQAAMASLREAGSVALAIYEEAPFLQLVALWREARAAGLGFVDLRRGVLRSEPEDRRLWTLRLTRGRVEGVVTLAPEAEDPVDDALAAELAKRVRGLSEIMVLVAPGAGNAALRAGASVLNVDVVEAGQALATLDRALGAAPPPKPAESRVEAPKAESKPSKPKPPSHVDRVEAVKTALLAEAPPTVDALIELVGPIKRVRDVLDVADGIGGEDAADRLRSLIVAIHRTVPERVRLLQATTLILKVSERTGRADLLDLLTEGETALRFGGPGVSSVIAATQAAQAAGWSLDRVLRGVTRRERREGPALDVLADHLEPLWRLLVSHGDVRGEIWVADALPPEGQAGLPQLALRDGHRLGVVGDSLRSAWVDVGAPTVVSVDALAEALGAWGA